MWRALRHAGVRDTSLGCTWRRCGGRRCPRSIQTCALTATTVLCVSRAARLRRAGSRCCTKTIGGVCAMTSFPMSMRASCALRWGTAAPLCVALAPCVCDRACVCASARGSISLSCVCQCLPEGTFLLSGVRACVRACVCVCVRACMRVRAFPCVRACVCIHIHVHAQVPTAPRASSPQTGWGGGSRVASRGGVYRGGKGADALQALRVGSQRL